MSSFLVPLKRMASSFLRNPNGESYASATLKQYTPTQVSCRTSHFVAQLLIQCYYFRIIKINNYSETVRLNDVLIDILFPADKEKDICEHLGQGL